MAETLIVRHAANSTLAGREQRFTKPVVRIGRRRGNDVVFDEAQDRLVSAVHAEVRTEPSGVTLVDLESSNGTFVNGRRLRPHQPSRIGPSDDVQLGGPTGPRLSLFADGPPPFARGADEFGSATIINRPKERSASPAIPAVPMHGQKQGIGQATLFRVVSAATAHERRRVVWIATGLLVVAVGAAAAYFFFWPPPIPPVVVDADAAALSRKLNEYKGSVYVVARRSRDQNNNVTDDPFGTAWSCAPGLLATNGHVARAFANLKPGETLIARSGATPPVDLMLVGQRTHPGYLEFEDLVKRYTLNLSAAPFESIKGGCDIAVLEVDPGYVPRQAPPLPIASDAELGSMKQMDSVGFIGFTMENRGLNMERPVPIMANGGISSISDFFLGAAPSDRGELIAFTAAGGGGASGSPVIAASGKVVCLLYAGDVTTSGHSGPRVSVPGAQTYGQRANILRELLDGSMSARQPIRRASWEQSLRPLFEQANAEFINAALKDQSVALRRAGKIRYPDNAVVSDVWEEVDSRKVRMSGVGAANAATVEMRTLRTGFHLIIAVPTTGPANIDIIAPGAEDTAGDFIPIIGQRIAPGQPAVIRVVNADTLLTGAVEANVKCFRLKV